MTNRKPPGTDWESWVDALIAEGRERGEFDNLPGHGKPIDGLDKPHDELWWVRKKLKEEGVSYLPPTLALRKDKEDTLAAIERVGAEARVRELLEALNARIRAVNRRPVQGPPSRVVPVDVEEFVAGWRRRRLAAATSASSSPGDQATAHGPAESTAAGTRRWAWLCHLRQLRHLRRPRGA